MADLPLAVAPGDPAWHRYTTADAGTTGSVVVYGADLPTEADLRLLGPVEGKRILDLGCGSGANAVVLAGQGAKVLAVDADVAALARARDRAETAEVRIELHQAGLAELAFLRSDSVDAALSVLALATVDDLDRVFRQVHRVLKPEAPFVCSFPHPAFAMVEPTGPDPLRIVRSYDDSEPRTWESEGKVVTDRIRTIGDVFTSLLRASFGVDQILEPTADDRAPRSPHFAEAMRYLPATVVFRARKQGN